MPPSIHSLGLVLVRGACFDLWRALEMKPSSFASSVLSEAIRQGHGQAACHPLALDYQDLRRHALVWKSICQYHRSPCRPSSPTAGLV
jgi:hypothetical protein